MRLDGKTVFENRVYETADCSDAIPVKAGWHEIEIVFENEKGRAGAAWPDYVDKGVPTGPGFGIRTGDSPASTDPADYFYPEDDGFGSVFRFPVEGNPIRVTGATRNADGTVKIDLAFENLPADATFKAVFADDVHGTSSVAVATDPPPRQFVNLGTVPACEKGSTSLVAKPWSKQPASVLRLHAIMPGAKLVWWSDVLRPEPL